MKKLLSIILISVLALSLFGCGGGGTSPETYKDLAFEVDGSWEKEETNTVEDGYDGSSFKVKDGDKVNYTIYVSDYGNYVADTEQLAKDWKESMKKPEEYDGNVFTTESVEEWSSGEFSGYEEIGNTVYTEDSLAEYGLDDEEFNLTDNTINFKTVAFDLKDKVYYLGVTIYNGDTDSAFADLDTVLGTLSINEGEQKKETDFDAEEITVGTTLSGEIKKDSGDTAVYSFEAEADKTYQVKVTSKTDKMTAWINLLDADGNEVDSTQVSSNEENEQSNNFLSRGGKYYISISSTSYDGDEAQDMSFEVIVDEISDVGMVSGTVNDKDGNPISNANMNLWLEAENEEDLPDNMFAITDKEGQYTFYGILPGSYNIAAFAEGYEQKEVDDVKATAGKTINQDFKLQQE